MVLPLEEAGPQYCFPVDNGFRCCNYTKRRLKDGSLVAVFNNTPGKNIRFFSGGWKASETPPDLEGLSKMVAVINQQNEKTPTGQGKGSDRLM